MRIALVNQWYPPDGGVYDEAIAGVDVDLGHEAVGTSVHSRAARPNVTDEEIHSDA